MPSETFTQGGNSCSRTSHISQEMCSFATCLLLKQPRTRRWWARRELRVEDGRTSSCLATPSRNTDLMVSLVYLKTACSPFPVGWMKPRMSYQVIQGPGWSCLNLLVAQSFHSPFPHPQPFGVVCLFTCLDAFACVILFPPPPLSVKLYLSLKRFWSGKILEARSRVLFTFPSPC